MAQKRMFSLKIVNSDAFIDMPPSTQALYFHLSMHADDDGFVNPKKIMRMLGTSEDDLKVLLVKRFVLAFENGVIVIKHWLIHNTIQKDRYTPTLYSEQKKLLQIKENGAYTDKSIQNVNKMYTQVRLGKDRLEIEAPLQKLEKTKKYLTSIPLEDLNSMYNRFDCSKAAIQSKAEDLLNWCETNGKMKKNYKTFLITALKHDFLPRKALPYQNRRTEIRDGKAFIIEE